MDISCSCGNVGVDVIPSNNFTIVKCKECGSVFDYGARVSNDEKHEQYVKYGEPDDGKSV